MDAIREDVRAAREHQRYYAANKDRLKAEYKAARKAGETPTNAGLGSGFGLLPWLLLGMGAFSNLFQGETPSPWIGGLGLFTFNSLYIYVAFRAFRKETREATSTRVALVLMGLVTCGLAMGYGGNWLLFFPLFGLATGAVVRLPHLRWVGTVVAVVAGVASVLRDGWGGLDTAYATWISTMVTAAIMSLSEAVRQLREAREELARRAVEEERLRFSRDLHDLLGHTLSVIVVKSEAARRLAPRDLDAALVQITDIESVGRQALTEIREAVTGYREGSLSTDLDRAASALRAAGITPTVHRSGPPLTAQTEVLLGWVVREAVTNVVRHSGAGRCEISVEGSAERVRLRVWDNGPGAAAGTGPTVGREPVAGPGPASGREPTTGTEAAGHTGHAEAANHTGQAEAAGHTGHAEAASHPGQAEAAGHRGQAIHSEPTPTTGPPTGTGQATSTEPATPTEAATLTEAASRTGRALKAGPATGPEHPSDARLPGSPAPEPPVTTPAFASVPGIGGTGLKGLTERLAAAGGRLEAGPGPRGGFVVRAELPVESVGPTQPDGSAETTREVQVG
ncbi:histidine kinase [Streptomyces sp. NPDC048420]|uniref:histidine kinase n=1 Tax=Streptomyces sp. NPDC048420 TaxID=3155755 RepID=UPI00342C4006